MQDEQESFGFLLSRHPLQLYAGELEDILHLKARDISRHVGRNIRMVGWLISSKTVWTKDDDPMSFISFEDETAIFETVFFPKAYAGYAPGLNAHEPFILEGTLEDDHGAVSLHVQRVAPLNKSDPRHRTSSYPVYGHTGSLGSRGQSRQRNVPGKTDKNPVIC
jgi:DNA polymerase III alpha subunit